MTPYSSYATLPVPLLNPVTDVLQNPLLSIARNCICSAMETGLLKGRLTLSDSCGSKVFGTTSSQECRKAAIHVRNSNFWIRVFLHYDIGFSEAYMNEDFDSPDIKEVLNLYVDNLNTLSSLASSFYKLASFVNIICTRFFNHSLSKAEDNVAGYNTSNELYKAFLSEEMQYSCPIWSDVEGGVRGDLEGFRRPGDLEAAQARKINHILTKARLQPGYRLLDIGGGWGGVAIAAARMGCIVDTITLSTEQRIFVEQRIKLLGLESRIRVHFMDYRNMPTNFEKTFDACVSLEVLENVGIKYMPTFLRQIDWALKDDNAVVVLTATTYPESTYTPYQGNDFVRKYHWPNGVSPSPTSLVADFERVLPGRFSVESIENFGTHYPRCLREWGRRFQENWTSELTASLIDRYPELKDEKMLEMFRRKWLYMFVYIEVAYSRAWLGCHCWTLVRPGWTSVTCA